jgi:serine/threonine protein kinase
MSKSCIDTVHEIKTIGFLAFYKKNYALNPESSDISINNIKKEYEKFLKTENEILFLIINDKTICGSGSFKQVFLGWDITNNNPLAIMKILIIETGEENIKKNKRLENEIQIMSKLEHENILKCKFSYNEKETFEIYKYIGTNFYNETLRDIINKKKRNEFMTYLELRKFTKDILNALRELQNHCIIHRDIKPENIFFDGTKYILGDFGCCTLLSDNIQDTQDTQDTPCEIKSVIREDNTLSSIGTPSYMSYEQLNQSGINYKSDLFSLGICILEIVLDNTYNQVWSKNKNYPDSNSIKNLYALITFLSRVLSLDESGNFYIDIMNTNEIKIPDAKSTYIDSFKDFLSKMIDKTIFNRSSIEELFKYRFLQEKSQDIIPNLLTLPKKKLIPISYSTETRPIVLQPINQYSEDSQEEYQEELSVVTDTQKEPRVMGVDSMLSIDKPLPNFTAGRYYINYNT